MAAVNTTLYGKQGETQVELAPKTTAAQVTVNDADGSASTVDAEIVKLRQQISTAVDAGVHFKGEVSSSSALPSTGYQAGWQYIVKEAGTYAGVKCEVGDLILCIKDYAEGSASDADWTVLQANLDGVVTGPETSVAQHVATFSDTSGTTLADSGFTLGASVPADAEFTDTTYAPATEDSNGLLTSTDYTKLQGIEAGADKTDAENVKAAGAFITAEDTSDSITEGTTHLFMTSAEREKLGSVASGAEVNQNAIAVISVGDTTITATSEQDTLSIEAGTGISLTADADAKKVTVAETFIDSCVVDDLESVPSNLRDGGLIILKA